jgi:hypothetical protein
MFRRFQSQRNFRAVDAKHARVASRGRMADGDAMSGQEAQLHQPSSDIARKVQTIQNSVFTRFQVHQRSGSQGPRMPALPETELHSDFSIRLGFLAVKGSGENIRSFRSVMRKFFSEVLDSIALIFYAFSVSR